tara:strand:- start:10348 stop:10578 length:231 start_codon:yes stop_codon:yes gene_type:complete
MLKQKLNEMIETHGASVALQRLQSFHDHLIVALKRTQCIANTNNLITDIIDIKKMINLITKGEEDVVEPNTKNGKL